MARSSYRHKGSARLALVRSWAVAATAILAAAIADAATEFAENSQWLAGALRDDHQEAILPVLLFGASVALSLILFIVLARISPGDPLLLRMDNFRTRSIDIVFAFSGSVLCVLTMEGYEIRFGGISPFDPHSVVLSHAVGLIVAFIAMGTLMHCVLRSAIRAASRASTVVVEFFVRCLRKVLEAVAAPRTVAPSAYVLGVVHVSLRLSSASHGFRAPPRPIRPLTCSA